MPIKNKPKKSNNNNGRAKNGNGSYKPKKKKAPEGRLLKKYKGLGVEIEKIEKKHKLLLSQRAEAKKAIKVAGGDRRP